MKKFQLSLSSMTSDKSHILEFFDEFLIESRKFKEWYGPTELAIYGCPNFNWHRNRYEYHTLEHHRMIDNWVKILEYNNILKIVFCGTVYWSPLPSYKSDGLNVVVYELISDEAKNRKKANELILAL